MSDTSIGSRLPVGARAAACALTLFAVGIAACSADDGEGGDPGFQGSGGSSSSSGGSSSGGTGGGAGGSGAGNSGGTGGIIGTDGGGGSGGGLMGCASNQFTGELVPVDIYILLDKSGSMSGGDGEPDKWNPVTGAISQFIGLVTGDVRMGMSLFPRAASSPPPGNLTCAIESDCGAYGPCIPVFGCAGTIAPLPGIPFDSCVSVDYTTPDVALAPVATSGAQITSVMGSNSPGGGTPTTPALDGTMDYLRSIAAQNPGRQILVALATDGEPGPCSANTVQDVANSAASALNGTPSIKTFAIGIGNVAGLNTIAQAGGTGQAIVVSAATAGQQFLDALNQIRGAVSCQYQIPAPPTGQADPNRLNVGITPPGGTQDVIPQVSGASACLGQPGWYYDNPAMPSQILLCPSSCDVVENTQGVVVDVVLGCPTEIR